MSARKAEAAWEAGQRQMYAAIEAEIGSGVICTRCLATLQSFADACTAGLLDRCEGFERIEAARARHAPNRPGPGA